jgi:chorismate mutase
MEVALVHNDRMMRIETIYRMKKMVSSPATRNDHLANSQPHVDNAVARSRITFGRLFVPPTLPSSTERPATPAEDAAREEAMLQRIRNGEKIEGPLSQEELDSCFTYTTLPNGERLKVVNLKGTRLEGMESEFLEMMKKLGMERVSTMRKAGHIGGKRLSSLYGTYHTLNASHAGHGERRGQGVYSVVLTW